MSGMSDSAPTVTVTCRECGFQTKICQHIMAPVFHRDWKPAWLWIAQHPVLWWRWWRAVSAMAWHKGWHDVKAAKR